MNIKELNERLAIEKGIHESRDKAIEKLTHENEEHDQIIYDLKKQIREEEQRIGKGRIKKFLEKSISNLGGFSNCYLTRGYGVISSNEDVFYSSFKLETTKGIYDATTTPFLLELQQIMREEKIETIQLLSPFTSDYGSYYPFRIKIDDSFYSLF